MVPYQQPLIHSPDPQYNNNARGIDRHQKKEISTKINALPDISDMDEEPMRAFIRMVDLLNNNLNSDEEERYMIGEIKYRLAGIQDLPNQAMYGLRTWNDVKRVLQERLNTTNTLNVLEARVSNFGQKSGETMEEYGKRARKLLHQFEAFYGNEISNHLTTRLNRDITLQFTTNVKSTKVRDALRMRSGKNNLEAVIQFAIEQETMLKREETDPELICAYCGRNGHRLRNCRTKDADVNKSNATYGFNSEKHCKKCDSVGHTHYQCQVRALSTAQNNRNANNSNSNGNRNRNSDGNESNRNNGNNRGNQNSSRSNNNGGNNNNYSGNNNYNGNSGNSGNSNNYSGNNNYRGNNNYNGNNNRSNNNSTGYRNDNGYNNRSSNNGNGYRNNGNNGNRISDGNQNRNNYQPNPNNNSNPSNQQRKPPYDPKANYNLEPPKPNQPNSTNRQQPNTANLFGSNPQNQRKGAYALRTNDEDRISDDYDHSEN